MNRVCLIGRLTKDPELRESESGKKQTTFSLAVNRPKEGADFINCVAWNKTAELISQYIKKGRELGIEGRIQTGSYEDREGNKRFTTNVVVENITFIGNKEQASASEKVETKTEEPDPFEDFADEVELTDDDLPF